MDNGLYFWNTWVAEVEVAITKQANDLTNPTQVQSTYANLFTIPDTQTVRRLLQNAEQVDAGGAHPYRLIPAKLIDGGEVIFSGNASLLSFQGGWKVSLAAALKGLFDALADTKLAELDLSRYDHKWTLDTIATFSDATEGVVYPVIDYGSLDNGVFAQDTITPAVYAKTLIHTMLSSRGYRAIGSWLNDPLFNRIVLPFTGSEPQAHDSEWQQARMARVTVTGKTPLPPFDDIDTILPLNRDNEPLSNWVDGKQNNFKADRYTYVCDVSMRLHVQAYQEFLLQIDFGGFEAMLIVLKNGQEVAQEYFDAGGPYTQKLVTLSLDEYVECQAGDEIQIRLRLQNKSLIAQGSHVGFLSDETTWASFEPDTTVRTGDVWPVAQNLPDLTCADLLKSVALMMSGTFDCNDVAKTLELRTLDSVLAAEEQATDLSHCIEESVEPENAVTISPYGQKNLLKWKAQDDKTLTGYGDGVIGCLAQNIPHEATLFELPFSAVIDSKTNIGGYGNPPFIKTRVVSGSGATVQVQKQAAPPCLLLVEPTKPVNVTVNAVNADLTTSKRTVAIMSCWWYSRPNGAQTFTNAFGLAFDRPDGITTREQTMSGRYFTAMVRILRRPRQLTPSVYLRPIDFATLNLYAPIRLRAVRAGSLDLNDNFYYLNKVSNYVSGQACTLVLIAY